MADRDDGDDEAVILQQAQDAIVAVPIGPEIRLIPLHRLPELTGIATPCDAHFEELDDPSADRLVESI